MNDMNNTTNPLTEAYETAPCSRCGGSGHYSYCQMYGTRCFQCAGKGNCYTKRALAAIEYARTLRTVKASEVQVGWLLYEGGLAGFTKAGWFVVTAVGGSSSASIAQDGTRTPSYDLTTSQCVHGYLPDSDVQAVPSKARLREIKALALAYQATLDAKGKVAKVYTPEQQAKREAAQAKREATKAAKAAAALAAQEAAQAAAAAAEAARQAEIQAKADAREAQRAAERAVSQFVGTVGERGEFTVTVEHTIRFEPYAYGWAASYLYLCRDAAGNRIVYKGSASFGAKGETVKVMATVAGHEEYKGERQTKLSRPKVLETLGDTMAEAS